MRPKGAAWTSECVGLKQLFQSRENVGGGAGGQFLRGEGIACDCGQQDVEKRLVIV